MVDVACSRLIVVDFKGFGHEFDGVEFCLDFYVILVFDLAK